jgi:hypothetical protein
MRALWIMLICCIAVAPPAQSAIPAGDATRLAQFLDRTRVEELWPAGIHIDWQSGVPDGKPEKSAGKHTHCSAFVASIAKRLGVYILRPPEHGQILLANAQYDWLADEGTQHGWTPIGDALQAQESANRGYLVVATYRNHQDDKPGHIAIVRPSARSRRDIESAGPQITQAGGTNYSSTTLERGFAGHPSAWTHREVRYYAHAIDWARVSGN